MIKKFFHHIWNDYMVVVSAVVIYLYYLLASIDLFGHADEKQSFFDYVLHFDSLIWMWMVTAALLQIQKYRKHQREQDEHRQLYQNELERQQIQNEFLDEVTALLQDNINNPLAIISLKTHELRRKFENDEEMIRWIENIEGATKRIEQTIRDLKGYQSQKMIQATAERISKIQSPSS